MNELSAHENSFKRVYGTDEEVLNIQYGRFTELLKKHSDYFASSNRIHLFSTPGRTEIGGNHTDHNNGRVLAGSINLDSIAAASKSSDDIVTFYSEGYERPFVVELENLSPIKEEEGDTSSLIRGIAARFVELGYKVGGFNGVAASEVLRGSGLSSSASIEVLIGSIFNALFNRDLIPLEELAKISQFAENNYFGKPCGLMDQMACAVGGIITIDFEEAENPIVEKVDFDFGKTGYSLVVVDTGGNHADLTDDYASIPNEMNSIASYFGKSYCREIDLNLLMQNIPELRSKFGDRSILRATHFILENERVVHQVEALHHNNFDGFLELITESGNSSFQLLQNIYPSSNVKEQGITLALTLTELYINEIGEGACRVHGGGFAGTIQAFLPSDKIDRYQEHMENVFGKNCVSKLLIRKIGAFHFSD